MTTATTIHR